ncbi:dCTP deaminase [Clostridium paraputrificum]|uniref:dCTP deaminase n=1 Tax=Clostridium paraputrificum TaxID=29363 RepID=UPI00233070D5|nr:dCTP deaminase [Clostridium paraputrificum]MDB2107874.1 dCTP deaminase [Clostridium paraputrificum]MDB2114828.1 dCTP deaminase [Clostridium paraputrificum]
MPLVSKQKIKTMMENQQLIVTPILDDKQIGETSIDLRIGNIFRMAKQTRDPYIDINTRNIEAFFDTTYRDFGQDFIIYPNQLVLANTFEFVKLPNNVMAHVYTRSSINRLGINIASIVQPGYSGTLTLEIINKGNTAVKLKSGMRIVQLVLFDVSKDEFIPYSEIAGAKYVANTEPKISNIYNDCDLEILKKI